MDILFIWIGDFLAQKDYGAILTGIYNSGISKRGMVPEESFENMVKTAHKMGIELDEIRKILGMNSKKMQDFNKAWIGKVAIIYQSLEKQPLNDELINEISMILSVLYLRHLQQKDWKIDEDYISFERLELSAEDYSSPNYLVRLCIKYFQEYQNEDLTDYQPEIHSILDSLIKSKPSVEFLESIAEENGFMAVFVESPDRLMDIPDSYNDFRGSKYLRENSGGVIRFAPTPNGPLHIGHGRGISILSEYADKYDMEFLLRFDDTDCSRKGSNLPRELKIPNIYNHIIEDFTWIRGLNPDKIMYASDRDNLERYTRYGRDLISRGLAYVYFDYGNDSYKYGQSVRECLKMYDEIINAGPAPDFESAGVLLGIPADNKTLIKLFNMGDDRIINFMNDWVIENVYSGKLSNRAIKGFSNTDTGTKIMRYQREQNIRVSARGESQWLWPTLNLQSVVDDKQEGVTHIVRGMDYDYEKAVASKDATILRTIRMQAIMRILVEAPPIASTGNWGNVSWDGGYTMSTSKLREMIMKGKFGNDGFLHPELPTIYALRSNSDNWGSSFRFYWTRFDLPNELDPNFKKQAFKLLNAEIKASFDNEQDFIGFNEDLIDDISEYQEDGTYLAEEF